MSLFNSNVRRRPNPQQLGSSFSLAHIDQVDSKQKAGESSTASSSALAPSFSALGPVLLALLTLLFVFATVTDVRLPDAKPINTSLHEFAEMRAWRHLQYLTAQGPRHTGSFATEVVSTAYLLREIDSIVAAAKLNDDIEVELLVQRPKGSFDIDFIGGFTSVYHNVTNLLVRVSNKKDATSKDSALLVSAHYDSALGVPAASDDAANIAVMLEILRTMSHMKVSSVAIPSSSSSTLSSPASSGRPLRHSIIFNFNGAEETILQASHGFITQHPWSASVVAVVNLEGAGGSGREIVFQMGPSAPWLVQGYATSVPYPYTNVVAQDIFQTGLIPSDTDFRIYRDFGGIPGLDIAFIDNGYIYHTVLDTAERVTKGAMQRCGDNVLAFLLHITTSSHLIPDHKKFVQPSPRHATAAPAGSSSAPVDVASAGPHVLLHHHADSGLVDGIALAEEAASMSPEQVALEVRDVNESVVYFDFFGLFIVHYTLSVARLINAALCLSGLLYLYMPYLRAAGPDLVLLATELAGFSWRASRRFVVSLLAALLVPVAVALLLDKIFLTAMVWYSTPALCIPLFVAPALVAIIYVHTHLSAAASTSLPGVTAAEEIAVIPSLDESDLRGGKALLSVWEEEDAMFRETLSTWIFFLALLTYFDIGSAYVPAVWVGFPLCFRLLALLPAMHIPRRSWTFVSLQFLGLCVPTAMTMQLLMVLTKFLIPVTGRAGQTVPADLIIAVLCGFQVFINSLAWSSWLVLAHTHYSRSLQVTLRVLVVAGLVSVVVASQLGHFPVFDSLHPKRIYGQHVDRTFYAPQRVILSHPASSIATASSQAETSSVMASESDNNAAVVTHSDSGVWWNCLDAQGYKRDKQLQRALLPDLSKGKKKKIDAASSSSSSTSSPPSAEAATAAQDDGFAPQYPLAPLFAEYADSPCAGLYCDFPLYFPVLDFVKSTVYFPAPPAKTAAFSTSHLKKDTIDLLPPSAPENQLGAMSLQLTQARWLDPTDKWSYFHHLDPDFPSSKLMRAKRLRLHFEVVGPVQMNVYMSSTNAQPVPLTTSSSSSANAESTIPPFDAHHASSPSPSVQAVEGHHVTYAEVVDWSFSHAHGVADYPKHSLARLDKRKRRHVLSDRRLAKLKTEMNQQKEQGDVTAVAETGDDGRTWMKLPNKRVQIHPARDNLFVFFGSGALSGGEVTASAAGTVKEREDEQAAFAHKEIPPFTSLRTFSFHVDVLPPHVHSSSSSSLAEKDPWCVFAGKSTKKLLRVQIAVGGHYTDHLTEALIEFKKVMPDYLSFAPWTSMYESKAFDFQVDGC